MERSLASSPRRSGSVSIPAGASPSLIDERFDHDSCGVGFVAAVNGSPSHEILQQALTALSRLAHRGATAADGKTSDGVGVMTAIPRTLLVKATKLAIGEKQLLGVGMLLLPEEETRAETLLERCLLSHDFKVLCWRDVPVARNGWEKRRSARCRRSGRCLLSIQAMSNRRRWNGGFTLRGSSSNGRTRRVM